ncbi:NADPH-dependent FMN reductase [Nakamurella endophytica]|uniref:FMN reductase n=1 Tax=Nakamurella endophytica TaxID=1748367 RepID=A0A917WI20_9ACTN|nr:NADPH-dependent FMN reductase [Nakamurella endophytica]GGM05593.1 FMN reductase [Nakamurella endophytica]
MSTRIVGIGGSVDPGSQSGYALEAVLARARDGGAEVSSFTGRGLDFPPYHSGAQPPPTARDYVEAVRAADAVVISSPGYHGTVSGLVKNALDYLEELRTDDRPYLHGRAVGLIAVARGWQAAVTTLTTLRQVTHALRGWPTPLGMAVNSAVTRFDATGATEDGAVRTAVGLLTRQLLDFRPPG